MNQLIKNWTTALRYKKYQDWSPEYMAHLKETVSHAKWRLHYHIQPVTGLLNDPNGFSYFNGEWHLFYQAYPIGAVHGVKSWAHMTSKDLIHWTYQGLPLLPDSDYDSHGVYSGSALPINNKLFLMYTGNVRTQNWERKSFQLGAWLNVAYQVEKIKQPLITTATQLYTQEFRDPQIFPYEEGYLAIIGAQDVQENGQIAVYQSRKDLNDWHLLGNLQYTDLSMGFMVECPNLVFIEGQPVLLFCPQGLSKKILAYDNIYPNTYILGTSFKLETLTIENATTLQNLDEGFDVYATQAFNAPDGRALSVSWVGLPEIDYPTFTDGWAHCLSLVKELSIKNGHLYQYPVIELQQNRQKERTFNGKLSSEEDLLISNDSFSYELELEIDKNEVGELKLFADATHTHYLKVSFDTKFGKIAVDRTLSGQTFAAEYGFIRTASIPAETPLKLNIFADESICEIFINEGYRVITLRLFPSETQTQLFISGKNKSAYHGKLWEMDTTIDHS